MGIGKDPRKGRTPKTGWQTEKLKGGGRFEGWLAGEVQWLDCHFDGVQKRSVPCFKLLTGCPVPCLRCKTFPRVTLQGYVPLYDTGGIRRIVIVKEDTVDIVMSIRVFDAVLVSRGSEWHDPVIVKPMKGKERYSAHVDWRKNAADITQALLTMWKEPDLTEWWDSRPDRTAKEAIEAATEAQRVADKEAAKVRALLPNLLKVRDQGAAGEPESIGTVLDKVTKPSTNGVHKPR